MNQLAEEWLARLSTSVAAMESDTVAALFAADGTWRDVLAFTWNLRTYSGPAAIAQGWTKAAHSGRTSQFEVRGVSRCERTERLGRHFLEVTFAFATIEGTGTGMVRLVGGVGAEPLRAWTLLTALDEIRGLRERNGADRPSGREYSRGFGTANWLDNRIASAQYEGSSPQVLIVGGGQSGLALAARLTQMGIDTLIVDRHERIGDNWRKRYHSLTLHNVVWTNHLPYLPFPPTWPVYIPKDMLANWFEFYADAMELNFWTATEFRGGTYDQKRGCWSVGLRRADGSCTTLHPNHVVIATGVSGFPNMPSIPGLDEFEGTVVHSSAFNDGSPYRGRRAIVVGTGTSGHDAAHDLYCSGADVTIVQRSATTILSLEPTAVSFYGLYSEERPTSWSDLITLSFPYDLIIESARRLTEAGTEADANLLAALHEVGFRTDVGEDGTGWQLKYLRYGGGYYFNVGCSELIADGKIHLRQYGEIERFTPTGVCFNDGSDLPLDLVVLATGYEPVEQSVAALFGSEIARRVGKIWGFDNQGEMSNVWRPTAQRGLWFTMGSLAQARIFSKYLAMQIWAQEQGRDQAGRYESATAH